MAYSDELWAEAKKKCRLNMEDIALAKRLGLNLNCTEFCGEFLLSTF
jgi:hypothetical protein